MALAALQSKHVIKFRLKCNLEFGVPLYLGSAHWSGHSKKLSQRCNPRQYPSRKIGIFPICEYYLFPICEYYLEFALTF